MGVVGIPAAEAVSTPAASHPHVERNPRASGRVDRRLALAFFLIALGVYALLGGGRFFSVDEIGVFQTSRRWVTDEPVAPSAITVTGRDGRSWSGHGPVMPLLGVPVYLLARAAHAVLPGSITAALAGEPLISGGLTWGGDFHIFAVSFFNAFVTAALVAFFFLVLRGRGHSLSTAGLTTAALAFATLLFAHSKNFFTHTLVAAFLLAAVVLLVQGAPRRDTRLLLVAGLSAALMMLTRLPAAASVPAMALYAWAATPSDWRARLRAALLFVAGPCAAVVLFALYNWYRFGRLGGSGFERLGTFDGGMLAALYGHLFSVGRSIFLYSPPLILAAAGFSRYARTRGAEAWLVLGIAACDLVVYCSWKDWVGGWSYGNRYLLHLVPVGMLALAPWLEDALAHRRTARLAAFAAAGLAGLYIQILGLGVNIAFLYHRYGFAAHPAGVDGPFIYDPRMNQLVAHHQSLWRGELIDFWLVDTLRRGETAAALIACLPWLMAIAAGAWIAWRARRAGVIAEEVAG